MQELTARQAQVLAIIRETLATEGRGPSIRAICKRIGVTGPNAVIQHIAALRTKGALPPRVAGRPWWEGLAEPPDTDIVAPAGDDLTQAQRRVLAVIRAYVLERGYAPTIRELVKILGFASPNGVLCHIKPLRKKGYLPPREGTHKARGLLVK